MPIRRKNKLRQIVLSGLPTPSPFKEPVVTCHAKFDFIEFTKPPARWLTPELRRVLAAPIAERRLKRTKFNWTIHDPSATDLRGLVNEYFDAEILGLELAVDFFPKSGRGLTHEALYDYLLRALWPTQFLELKRAKRGPWTGQGTRHDSRMRILPSRNTVYWKEPRRYFELKLYIKPGEGRKPKRVRVELRMNRGGCQRMQISRLGKLPQLIRRLRVAFRDAFTIVRGTRFRPSTTKSRNANKRAKHSRVRLARAAAIRRALTLYGAEWAARKGLPPAPDAGATRVVGKALQNMARRNRKVEIDPKKRAHINRALSAFPF